MAETRTRVRLGGLWTHKTNRGETFLSGSLGSAQIVIYPNGFKKTDKDPSHIAYLEPRPERSGNQPATRPQDNGL